MHYKKNYLIFVLKKFCFNMSQEEKEQIIKTLEKSINTLISIHKRSVEENEQLFKEKQLLYKRNKEKDVKIAEMQKEINNLKFGNAIVLSNSDNEQLSDMRHEAKIKINRIVREIDKCVAQLNKLN